MQEEVARLESLGFDQNNEEDQETLQRKRVAFYSSKYQIPLVNIDKTLKHRSSPIVNSLHLAMNLTFVAQVTYKKIQHYSATGMLLFQEDFNKIISFIFMASKSVVIMFLRSVTEDDPNDEIVQLDLNTYQMITIPHRSELKQIAGGQVFTQTQLFCIKQLKSYVRALSNVTEKVKLTYYQYPLKKQGSQIIESDPVYTTYFNVDEQKNMKQKLKIIKLNDKSMIGIVGQSALTNCTKQFNIFNPLDCKDKWRSYFFEYELKTKPKNLQFYMDSAWEIEPDVLFLKFTLCPQTTSLTVDDFFQNQLQLMEKERAMLFTWKYKTKKRSVQISNLTKNCPHFFHFQGQNLSIDYGCYLKPYIHDSRLKKTYSSNYERIQFGQILPTQVEQPIIYLNNSGKTSVVTATDYKKFRILLKNQYILGEDLKIRSVPYSPLKYLEYSEYYDEQNKNQILRIQLKILKQLKYPVKIIATHLLQNMIQNCDDDLLYYVSQIIEDDDEISYHQID